MQEFLALLAFYALFFLEIGLVVLFYKKGKFEVETTRKMMHLLGGILTMFIPFFFESVWVVGVGLLVPLLFLGITYLTGSLNALHKTKRFSLGTIIIPLPIFICFAAMRWDGDNLLYYFLPMTLLTFADSAAQIVGQKLENRTRPIFGGKKTVAGSLSFFVVSILCGLVCYAALSFPLNGMALLQILVIAAVATLVEMVSIHGWDNVTVPLVVLGLLILMV